VSVIRLPPVSFTPVAVLYIPIVPTASIRNTVLAVTVAVVSQGAVGVVVAAPMASMVAATVIAVIAATEVLRRQVFGSANIGVADVMSTKALTVAVLTAVIAVVGSVGVTLTTIQSDRVIRTIRRLRASPVDDR
jgi:hypothetical protein